MNFKEYITEATGRRGIPFATTKGALLADFEIETPADLKKVPDDALKAMCKGNKIKVESDWNKNDMINALVDAVGENGMKLLNQYVGKWKSGSSKFIK